MDFSDNETNKTRIFRFEEGTDWKKILDLFFLKGQFIAFLEKTIIIQTECSDKTSEQILKQTGVLEMEIAALTSYDC